MTLVELLVVLAIVGVVAAVVLGSIRSDLAEPTSTLPPTGMPEGELHPSDVTDVRFPLGLRGYRMREVDEVLDRLADELSRKDEEIARLRAQVGPGTAEVSGTGWTAPENG